MNKIEMNKKYKTREGYPVTLYNTTGRSLAYPIHGCVHGIEDRLSSWTSEGIWNPLSVIKPNPNDLVEITPWDELKVDDRVLVRGLGDITWNKRYFAGINDNGRPTCFEQGRTSWTSWNTIDGEVVQWDECIPYIEGEDYGV